MPGGGGHGPGNQSSHGVRRGTGAKRFVNLNATLSAIISCIASERHCRGIYSGQQDGTELVHRASRHFLAGRGRRYCFGDQGWFSTSIGSGGRAVLSPAILYSLGQAHPPKQPSHHALKWGKVSPHLRSRGVGGHIALPQRLHHRPCKGGALRQGSRHSVADSQESP